MEKSVLDLLYVLLQGAQDGWKLQENFNGKTIELSNLAYLLNQILRQIKVPQERYLYSVEAKKLWFELTDEKMENHNYNSVVHCRQDLQPIILNSYSGGSSKPQKITLKGGSCFRYREIFHDEHIIPISTILHKLSELDLSNKENALWNISRLLDKVYICRMLKDEDRSIYAKYKRPFDIIDVVENVYKHRTTNIYLDGINRRYKYRRTSE